MILSNDLHPSKAELPILYIDGRTTIDWFFTFTQRRVSNMLLDKSVLVIRNWFSKKITLCSLQGNISIFLILKHDLKAHSPIEIIEEGIVIFVNDRQYLKALCPIDVKEKGRVICFNELHP